MPNTPQAHYASGHVQGKNSWKFSALHTASPTHPFEIGIFTGYSALTAKGLLKDGELHTIELREDDGSGSQSKFCSQMRGVR